ncbi:serine--tRNA ligase [Candidatus Gottesmanbacteria bacterium]|nr:serine--tRNA ligase [Candidatus Gottesmanbacteria bacterium]
MISIDFIKKDLSKAKDLLQKRNIKVDLEQILSLDTKRQSLQEKIQLLREERNKISKRNTEETRARGKEIKDELKILEPEFETIYADLKTLLKQLPNTLHPKTPIGKSEEENIVLKEHGQKPAFSFQPLDHTQLGKKLSILDFEKGAKVAGSNFYFLKNQGVELEFALMKYALDTISKEGFDLYQTPDLAKQNILDGLGFNPRGAETQIYNIENSDLSLIGTAEATLGGYYSGEILNQNLFPLKLGGFSHCFRTEAGGYGRESRGLYRVHQFSKVEMFVYCLPGQSEEMHEYLLSLEEKIYKELGFPYRVVDICSGDLGAPAYRKYDIEVWMPGLNKWGEVTSASNCTDYQSRRLNIKYRRKDGSTDYVHTLNGTAIASSRTLISLLELNQQEDGTVKIPKVLQKYTGFSEIKPHGI